MYGSVAGFETYHETRGKTIPASWDNTSMSAALLVASEWLDNKYGSLFSGFKTDGYTQTREWPRSSATTNTYPQYVFADDEIPDCVVYATYEAAWREAVTAGALQSDFTPEKYTSVSIQGALSVDYAQNLDVSNIQIQIQIVDQLLSSVLSTVGRLSSISGSTSRV